MSDMSSKLFVKYADKNGNIRYKISTRKLKEYLCVLSIVTWPLLIFVVFWAGGTLTGIFNAFQLYNVDKGQYEFLPWNDFFRNMERFAQQLQAENGLMAMSTRSAIFYFANLAMTVPELVVSFCIYKKVHFSEFFKVVLFLPRIISGVVWVLIYKNIVEYGLPWIVENLGGTMPTSLFMNPDTVYGTLIVYNLWIGFAGGMVINTGTLSGISYELVEAGQMDGMNTWQEFWHIALPKLYPIFTIGLYTGIGGLITGGPATYAFYGENAPSETHTFGYYLTKIVRGQRNNPIDYPYVSACHLIFAMIITPITFILKHLFEKYGPSEN